MMTGREIQELLTDTKTFFPRAIEFEGNKSLDLSDPQEALNFLCIYLVSLFTAEYLEYDENKLLQSYSSIRTILSVKKRISSKEFLSDPTENLYYVLSGNRCLILRSE